VVGKGQDFLDFTGYSFRNKHWIYEHIDSFLVGHIQVDNTCVVNFHAERGTKEYVSLKIEDIDFSDNYTLILNMQSDVNQVSFKASSKDAETMRRIVLNVGGHWRQSHWTLQNGWYYLDKSRMGDIWSGIPEPSTSGAALSFSALGVLFIRKRKKRKARSLTLPATPV